MWICLRDSFLSIVRKDCDADHLLVRARRREHIKAVFPKAKIIRTFPADYRFRAVIPITEIVKAMKLEIESITYPNFKDAVKDNQLHDAYLRVWSAMASLQDSKPARGSLWNPEQVRRQFYDDLPGLPLGEVVRPALASDPARTPRKRRRKNRRNARRAGNAKAALG